MKDKKKNTYWGIALVLAIFVISIFILNDIRVRAPQIDKTLESTKL